MVDTYIVSSSFTNVSCLPMSSVPTIYGGILLSKLHTRIVDCVLCARIGTSLVLLPKAEDNDV